MNTCAPVQPFAPRNMCGDSGGVAGILSGEKGNSVVNCTITCPVEAIGEYKQYAGALLGGTNTTVVLDGIEIDVSLPVYNDAAYGLCGYIALPNRINYVTKWLAPRQDLTAAALFCSHCILPKRAAQFMS